MIKLSNETNWFLIYVLIDGVTKYFFILGVANVFTKPS